jgi:large subunit ribosomal protein L10
MPSAKILEAKQAVVAELAEKVKTAASGVIVSYQGITVEDDTKLRAELRNAGVEYKVYKNSITGRACEEAGYGDIRAHLEGMTAIAISQNDAVAPAKILKNYADKIETFNLKCGFVDGEVLDEAGVKALADIPNKETLVCKIMGCMRSPLYSLAYVLQAVIDKDGEAPAAEAAAE